MSNVIELKDFSKPIFKITKNYCRHKFVELDQDERTITCTSCGKIIDPFDYVLNMAYEERNAISAINVLKQEIEFLEQRKQKLKK